MRRATREASKLRSSFFVERTMMITVLRKFVDWSASAATCLIRPASPSADSSQSAQRLGSGGRACRPGRARARPVTMFSSAGPADGFASLTGPLSAPSGRTGPASHPNNIQVTAEPRTAPTHREPNEPPLKRIVCLAMASPLRKVKNNVRFAGTGSTTARVATHPRQLRIPPLSRRGAGTHPR